MTVASASQSVQRCPKCGREYPAIARFCVDCSVPLEPFKGSPAAAAASGAVRSQGVSQPKGGGKMGTYFLIWVVLWVAVAALMRFVFAPEEPMAVYGVALAAVISLVIMVRQLGDTWSGDIVEIRTERVEVGDDEDSHMEDMDFAYIRLASGQSKKMRAMPDWKAGNRIEKRRGEGWFRVT